MKKHVVPRLQILISVACIIFVSPVERSRAQNAADFMYVQSIPSNSRVFLIKEADKYKNWQSDQKNFIGSTPLTKRIVAGEYLVVVRSRMTAGKTFFNKKNINDGESESGYLVVGNQGEVDLYKQYSIKKHEHFPVTLTSIFMQYGNSLSEILKNIPKERNFEYDFRPEIASSLFSNLKIPTEDFPTAVDILKKIGVIANENGVVILTTAGGFRSSIEEFDPPVDLKKFLIKLYVAPGKKKETITFQSDEYADGTRNMSPKGTPAPIQIEVDKRIFDIVNAWDKDIRLYTSKSNPLRSLEALHHQDIAAWGAELMPQVKELCTAIGETEQGVRIIGLGNPIFSGMQNPPRLFITWASNESDLKGAVKVELREKR